MIRRILVIDDEASILVVVKTTLEITAGWKVITTDSAMAGFEIAKREQPDAILLDVVMPDLDGVTVFQKLQMEPQTQDIPVIFLTAKARYVERESLEHLGSAGMIYKPFEAGAIADQVKTLLGWAH
ncbi:MAG: response regulator [Phormidesmis sp.]